VSQGVAMNSVKQDFVIRESDQIRRDYEARMHSKIKDTVAEERARAANAIEIVTETQEDEKRNLQNGLQQAVARNYRIRQSHENEVNQLLAARDADRQQSAAQIRELEANYDQTQEQLKICHTERTQLSEEANRLRGEIQGLRSTAEKAKNEVEAARRKALSDNNQLKKTMGDEMRAKIEKEVETRLAEAQVSLSVKQQQTYKQEQDNTLNARVSAEQQAQADAQLAKLNEFFEKKAAQLKEACDTRVEVTVMEYSARLQKSEAAIAQLKQVNAELSAQLRMLSNTEDERAQAWKNHEATVMFELAAARKATERVELQRDETERKLETVIKESDTMRRVFEAALNEADSVAAMLKEQLDIVRGSSREQALASDQEIQKQKEALDAIKAEKSSLELSKLKSEAELRDELQSLQITAEQLQMGKEKLTGELQDNVQEGQRSKNALGASINEAHVLAQELEAADQRCESIQREAEVRWAVLEAEKVKAVEEYRSEAATEKAMANEAREITTLAEKKLRQAEMALSRSKYELGTALQQAQKMRLEQEEAEVVLDLLDGTLADVRDSHAELVYEADDIVACSKEDLSTSMRG